jgi:hypothetical protein
MVNTESSMVIINIETMLMHISGEWILGINSIPISKNDPQGAGSAITYARRYGLSAILGIHQEDDDANSASGKASKPFDSTSILNRCIAKLDKKDISDENRQNFIDRLDHAATIDEFALLEKQIDAIKSKPAEPTAHDIQIECSTLLKQLVDNKIDRFDSEARRIESFQKHLNKSDTLRDCQDVKLLKSYKLHLLDKLAGKKESAGKLSANLSAAKIAAIQRIGNCTLTGEEKEDLVNLISAAKEQADIDAVLANMAAKEGQKG